MKEHPILDPLDRDRANALGARTYLNGRSYKNSREPLFAVLDAVAATPDTKIEGPAGARLLAGCATILLKRDNSVIRALRRRKITALDDPQEKEELFALLGALVVEDYLSARSGHRSRRLKSGADPIVSPRSQDVEQLLREARRQSRGSAPLRELSEQFLVCLNSDSRPCSFRHGWCRPLAEGAISATHYVAPHSKVFSQGQHGDRQPLDQALDDWLAAEAHSHLLLLGDYGVGKTAACLHLFRRLAEKVVGGDESSLVPVYVPLDTFARQGDGNTDLRGLLQRAWGEQDIPEEIDATVEPARRLYLLDGLDEMGASAKISSIRANLDLLKPFLSGGARAVLTCRTHLFASATDLDEALSDASLAGDLLRQMSADRSYAIIELQKLSPEEAKEIIGKALPDEDPEAVWAELGGYYDLWDLAARPILLGLVLRSLPVIRERAACGETVDEAWLYDAYVRSWVLREMSNKDLHIDPDEKLRLAETIAISMYQRGVLAIDRETLLAQASESFGHAILSRSDLELFDYDARDASFLASDLAGNYRFMHASLQEYFAARALLNELDGEVTRKAWGTRWLDREVANFLSQLVQQEERPQALSLLVRLAAETTDEVELWNALHVLSLVEPGAIDESERQLIANSLVPRGFAEGSAVVVRQYARVAARFVSDDCGSALIDLVLDLVNESEAQQKDNNETYVNYYGGSSAACAAFLNHLSAPARKYDRRLHVHVLGQLGSPSHVPELQRLARGWEQGDAEAAIEAAAAIAARVG
jgi:hypothetical protein